MKLAEGNFAAVEEYVESQMKNDTLFQAFFNNTYRMENGKVKAMTSYLVPKHPDRNFNNNKKLAY